MKTNKLSNNRFFDKQWSLVAILLLALTPDFQWAPVSAQVTASKPERFEIVSPDKSLLENKIESAPQELSSIELMESGLSCASSGLFAEAIKRFRLVLEREPNNVEARNNLAVCLKRRGQTREAISELIRATKVNPLNAELYNNLASAYLADGDNDSALNACYAALHLKPIFPAAQFNLAHVLALRNDHVAAVEAYQTALKDVDDNPQYYRDLGDSFRALGKCEQALSQYANSYKHGDKSQSLRFRQAKCNEALRRLEKAHGILVSLIDESPQNTEYLNSLGVVLWKMKHLSEAAYVLEKALKLEPTFYRARNNLGIVLYDLKRYQEAIDVWRQALSIKPDYAQAHFNMGTALIQAGLYSQAVDAFNQCLKNSPDDAQAHNNLGLSLIKCDRADEAIEHWREAIKIDPNLAQAFTNLGRALKEKESKEAPATRSDS